SPNIQLLLNKQANIGNMVSAFEWLKDESVEGDQVIIYFSGHGDVETLTDAHNGFLLTYNSPKAVYFAGAFPVYILKDYLTTLSKKDVQVTFIVDACRSGKLAGGAAGASQTNQVLQQQWQNEVKILSCQPGEYSLESASMGGGRGIFSYHLIRGLQGLADMNKNMEVTLSELWMYLSIQVPMATDPLPQNPLVSGKMQTTLANVDLATLQALHEDQGTLGTLVASLNPKGFVDDILEKIDTADARSYRIFEKSLEDGDLLTPVRFAAYEIYIDFLSKEIEEKKQSYGVALGLAL
ncbi:MAG: caspase family protein, partial [Bacteroidetes bacterium]|nr:caspase family protein [Bacteroidota bacterium]